MACLLTNTITRTLYIQGARMYVITVNIDTVSAYITFNFI